MEEARKQLCKGT